MLDAYLLKGAQLPTEPSNDGRRRVVEDAITSTLFTPLRFMPAADVVQVVNWLWGREVLAASSACDVRLWPRVSRAQGDGAIEPDLLIDFDFEEGKRFRLIVEIKWDSPLLFEQVRDQYAAVSRDMTGGERQSPVRHLSIVKAVPDNADDWMEQGWAVRAWHQVLRTLHDDNRNRVTPAGRWKAAAQLMLQKLGIGTFQGFTVPIGTVREIGHETMSFRG